MSKSLTTIVTKSAGWVFAAKFVARLLDFLKIIILARLLAPEDFGLFGLVMLTTLLVDTFSQTGLHATLVQHRGQTKNYLDTAWTIQVFRGIILALGLYIAAPMAASFFNEPRIIFPLKVISISFIIQGFINIETIYFQKDFKFNNQFYYDIISNFFSAIIGVILAYLLRSVWALIWANMAGTASRLILSYIILNYKPRLYIKLSQCRELFNFGKWMTGYAIAQFGWQQVDKIIIGKLLGPIPLGIFQLAQRISDIPVSNLANTAVNFTFPAYSKIEAGSERLGQAFLDVFETLISIILPLSVFSFLAAPDIVYGLLSTKWEDAVLPLQLLSVAAFFTSLDSITTPLFVSVGKPNIEFYKNLLKTVVLILIIIPLIKIWGLTGACISIIISSVVVLPILSIAISVAKISFSNILIRLYFPFCCGILVALSTKVSNSIFSEPGLSSLIFSIFTSFTLCYILSILFARNFNLGIYKHITRLLKSLKN